MSCGNVWTSIPYGKPMLNQTFHVLTENLVPRPVWVPGQLYIGGIGLAKGYWRDEEKTNASFIEDPASGQRLYRTGDLGRYLPDGNIEFLGREDFQIKLRGYRIELGEIEAAISAHADVHEAVVVVREDVPGDRRLVGYYVARERQGPETDELLSSIREKLPAYMIPSLVKLDVLPRTINGKLDRAALPAPERTPPETGGAFMAPRTRVEQQLADIISEILGVEKLGIRDNFFDRGGHSLQVTRAISRIHRAFQAQIPLARFYQVPTVEGLALELIHILAKANSPKDMQIALAQQEAWSETLPVASNGNARRKALSASTTQPDGASNPGFSAARDGLEHQLTKICGEIFGVPKIGIHHNFFELGGDSLLVARLLARIEREFSRRLTVASVFASPTIEQLATLLRNSTTPTPFTQLFPIQPAGSKPPFFCVGVTIGGGFFYRPLSRYLGIEQPMLGVQLDQSVVDQLHVPYTVEELAGYMVQAICKQQHGPYFLGGFCNNGTLVYETARQLLKAGHRVALLAIFEARNDAYFRRNSNGHGKYWKRLAFHLQKLRQQNSVDACRYLGERLNALWQTVHTNSWDLFHEFRARRSAVRLTDIDEILSVALTTYKPKPYPGRVAIFRADTKADEALSGWRGVIAGPVEVHDVPGAHMGMFFDPHVSHWAGRLAACIDNASEPFERRQP
jgi:thioesterase domain-containing protein/acyl carrier protein